MTTVSDKLREARERALKDLQGGFRIHVCDEYTSQINIFFDNEPYPSSDTVEFIETAIRAALAGACEAGRAALEKYAIVWELKPATSEHAGDEIRLERRDGFKGRRWAITQRGCVLNKQGVWEYEPQPSSRTEEWLETVRWGTSKEAESAARALGATSTPVEGRGE